MDEQTGYATSPDGTRIGFEWSGDGPALLLIHGTSADRTRWDLVRPHFEQHFRVYALDRRGRGLSGDVPSYAMEREYEDAAAVIEALPRPVDVFGHSFGALVALEACLLTDRVRRLVLYEPLVRTAEPFYLPGHREHLERLIAGGDPEAALIAFLRDSVGMSGDQIEAARAAPSWAGRVAAAHTIPREFADGDYVVERARLERVSVPTLLLSGSESDPALRESTALVAAALPDSRVQMLAGQGHVATITAPELLASVVTAFLREA